MTRRSRWLIGGGFTLAVFICAFAAGTFVAGRLLVPPGSGLAGPAIAVGYGVLAAGMFAIAAVFLSIFLPGRWLAGLAMAVGAVALVFVVIGRAGYLRSERETQAHMDEAYERLPVFRLRVDYREPDSEPAFRRFEANWQDRSFSADGLTGRKEVCSGALTGPDAVKLLGALRDVEGLLLRQPEPCDGYSGQTQFDLDFHIAEVTPPDNEGRISVTAACLAAYPALGSPARAAAGLLEEKGSDC